MARRRALEGMVPQWVAPPPTAEYRSTAATFLPPLAAFIAAPSPAGPVPITMTSKWVSSVMNRPLYNAAAGGATAEGRSAGLLRAARPRKYDCGGGGPRIAFHSCDRTLGLAAAVPGRRRGRHCWWASRRRASPPRRARSRKRRRRARRRRRALRRGPPRRL